VVIHATKLPAIGKEDSMDSSKSSTAVNIKPAVTQGSVSSPAPKLAVPEKSVSAESSFADIRSSNKKASEAIANSHKEIEQALAELKRLADNSGRSLGFSKDQAVSGPVITVTDKETGKVVRQIPNEVVVHVAHNIEKMKGLLFDKSL
jgi:flagellar protein FlaG